MGEKARIALQPRKPKRKGRLEAHVLDGGSGRRGMLKPRKRSGHQIARTAEFPGKVRAGFLARACKTAHGTDDRRRPTDLTELRVNRVEGRSAHTGAGTYKATSGPRWGRKAIETLWNGALGEVCPYGRMPFSWSFARFQAGRPFGTLCRLGHSALSTNFRSVFGQGNGSTPVKVPGSESFPSARTSA